MKKVTIVGAGLGGLTAGALLAKRGYDVTLLEQHTVVGGCATTFNRKGGFICEVGLHEMDGVYSNPSIVKIFKKLGVYEAVEFVKAPEFFEVRTKRGNFLMPDGVVNAKKALVEKFPHEKKGIEAYFKIIEKVGTSLEQLQNASWYHYLFFPFFFWNILRYKPKSVSAVLNKLMEDEELKLILNSNVQYYNDTPDTLSFLLHAVAQYSYYKGGGYFIKGGSGRLSDHLAQVVRENGGEVITQANVVSCSENRVEYLHKKEQQSIYSDMVISNLSPEQSYKLYKLPYTEKRALGNALLTIYLGFSKNLKDVYGTRAYSNFIFDEIRFMDDFKKSISEDILKRPFIFVDYAQLDSGLTKDSTKSFGVTTTMDAIEEWEALSHDAYEKRKEELIVSTLKRLEKHYPNISDLVEYAEVGTAKSVKRYIKTPNGTAYGFKPTPEAFFRVPNVQSNKVDNLYFVGQWVIAGGFSPSIVSGLLCYEKIVGK